VKKEHIIVILGVIIALLFMSNYFGLGVIKQLKANVYQLNQLMQQKDTQIKSLTNRANAKQQELNSVKEELDSTKQKLASTEQELSGIKKDLDSLNKKFGVSKTIPATIKK